MANTLNLDQIRRKIATSKPVLEATEKQAKKIAQNAVIMAQDDFANNDITKEIEAGPSTSNSSGLLNGYGNLFSFFGLISNPIPILKQLWGTTTFNGLGGIKLTGRRALYTYKFKIPSPTEFEINSSLPWAEGKSFLTAITYGGVSNLGYYLSKVGRGRSGGGLQLKTKLRNVKMKTDPYFSKIYNAFGKTFKGAFKA